MNPQSIAESLLGKIEWQESTWGYTKCPGENLHSNENKKRDCRVHINGAPTIYCLHNSCSSIIEDYNLKLRRAMGKSELTAPAPISKKEAQAIAHKRTVEDCKTRLEKVAEYTLPKLLNKFHWPLADIFEDSPLRPDDDPINDRILFLHLFNDDDILWNGDVMDSGTLDHTKNFKQISEWKKAPPLGNFTCSSVFKPGSFSRSNENVLKKPFLVIESDTLTFDQMGSIFAWCRTFMNLRAIIHTGGKSLHGWFDHPSDHIFQLLKIILPKYKCDRALFKPSQPVRIPGVKRGTNFQTLYWISL